MSYLDTVSLQFQVVNEVPCLVIESVSCFMFISVSVDEVPCLVPGSGPCFVFSSR